MRMHVYFLISPKRELLRRVGLLHEASAVRELIEPRLWSAEMPCGGMMRVSDYQLLAQVLFLDSVDREYSGFSDFGIIFPDFAKNEQFFSSLWEVRRIELENSVEFALEEMIGEGKSPIEVGENERVNRYLEAFLKVRKV